MIHSKSNGNIHQKIYGSLEVKFKYISSEIRNHYLFSVVQCYATIFKIWVIRFWSGFQLKYFPSSSLGQLPTPFT